MDFTHTLISKLPVQIYVATTWVGFYSDEKGNIAPGINIAPFIRMHLQEKEWVYSSEVNGVPIPGTKKLIVTANYTTRDKVTGFVKIPRYTLDAFISFLGSTNVTLIPVEPVAPRPVEIRMKKGFELRENQKKAMEFIHSGRNFIPLNLPTGFGKGLRHGTPVLTSEGWLPIEYIEVGDKVVTPSGKLATVTGVFPQGIQQIVRVAMKDGRWADCDFSHLWTFMHAKSTDKSVVNISVVSTRSLVENKDNLYFRKFSGIPLPKPFESEDISLPLDPYVLGALLGNGYFTSNQVQIATDIEIIDEIMKRLDYMYLSVTEMHPPKDTCHYVRFTHSKKIKSFQYQRNPLLEVLDRMGLQMKTGENKFIPKEYLNASPTQRLDLLRGLLDTDGSAYQTSIEFCSVSENLAKSVQYLARSLGYKARLWERAGMSRYKGIYHKVKHQYLIYISGGDITNLFSLPRKKAKLHSNTHLIDRSGVRIQSVAVLPDKDYTTCIKIDDPDGMYVIKDFIVTHNTTIALKSISDLSVVSMIMLPTLIDQWYRSIRQFTRLESKDIFVIKGFNSLKLLWDVLNRGYQPKIILAAMRTLFQYAVDPKGQYLQFPSWQQLQEKLGIGMGIYEETHLWFHTNVRLQLTCNFKYNVFLSATFARTEWKQDQIFQMIFPTNLRYRQDDTNKYTVVNFIEYSLGIPQEITLKFTTQKFGYNHAKYEKYLLKHRGDLQYFMTKVLIPLVNMYYIAVKKKGQKCLILTWTKALSTYIRDRLVNTYPDLKVNVYFSGTTSENNLNSDIIVSTHKSCGVGVDIKGLKTCINTVSFGSAPMTTQVMGRLREIPGEDTIYVDMWNKDVGSHQRHYYDRLRIYKQLAKLVFENKIT